MDTEMTGAAKRISELWDKVPSFSVPKLGREVEIPVYLIHNSPDVEDYFFLIDFEEFVERSTQGLFVRPKLKIFAGRDDFSRIAFAAHFRQVFASEFDRMRSELGKKKGRGWLSWNFGFDLAGQVVSNLTSYLIILIATGAMKAISNVVSLPKWMKGKSAAVKLEDEIENTQKAVETALTIVDVSVHPELYEYAYRDGGSGKISTIERNAWPLPAHVRTHLKDKTSGSWW